MKQDIVKDLTTDEVRDKIKEERATYRKMKISHAVSPMENPMKMRASRKVIARLETELNKRISQNQSAQ